MLKTPLRSVRFYTNEWANYIRAQMVRKLPAVRFICFAHSRSGSHLLADLSNSHPKVTFVTEQALFLRRRAIANPIQYLDGVSKRFPQSPVFGGKTSVRQLMRQAGEPKAILADLAAAGWKFMILERENTLHQVISALLAKERQTYHDTVLPSVQQLQIEINLEALHQKLKHKTDLNRLTGGLLASYNPLKFVYEPDLIGTEAQQRTADRIFNWLDLNPVSIQTNYVKTGVYALSDYITNYDEMVESLQGTSYAQFLSKDGA